MTRKSSDLESWGLGGLCDLCAYECLHCFWDLKTLGTGLASGLLDTSVTSDLPGTSVSSGVLSTGLASGSAGVFVRVVSQDKLLKEVGVITAAMWVLRSVSGLWVMFFLGFLVPTRHSVEMGSSAEVVRILVQG